MKVELKTWAGLGLATALAGAGLPGCADSASPDQRADEASSISETGEGGEGGESGESGESGEGGVDIADAASDPVVYGSALAVAEAHAIAARDAFLAGKTDPAAEMFGHPVSEVLADMDPVFAELGVSDFKPLFNQASASVLNGESAQQINARFEAIIEALRKAEQEAPDNGTSAALVAAGVAADQIDRAISMYREALSSDRYEPYLDGYGFYKAGARVFETSQAAIQSDNAELHANIANALELLGEAYPNAERPGTLEADLSRLTAAGSRVLLSLPQQ